MREDFRDDAVVLRTRVFAEADRMVTLMTHQHGKLRALARGVRKTRSRIGARLEPGMHVDIQCHRGKTFIYVNQVDLKSGWGAVFAHDYQLFTTASAMLEACERITSEDEEPAPAQYRLLLGALHALAARRYDPSLILDAFLIRSVAVAGFAPSVDECAECGATGPHRGFNIKQGGSVCGDCRGPGTVAISYESRELIADLLTSNWNSAQTSTNSARSAASRTISAYAQWHIETGVRALPLVERGN